MSTPSTHPPSIPQPLPDLSIEWEPMPSLINRMYRPGGPQSAEPVWADTLPVQFDAVMSVDEPIEPLPGMTFREMTDPDIFDALFGHGAAKLRRG